MDLLDVAACVLLLPLIVLGFIVLFPALARLMEMSMEWWLEK
jgi:hypothetical protein